MQERVGVILVHGIGEQKRFQHLDDEVRGLLEGIRRQPNSRCSVEILRGDAAPFQSDQDTWAGGGNPSVRITVTGPGRTTEVLLHEVWWADVNEPYSLAKQVRFWLWGLSVWMFPQSKKRTDLRGSDSMLLPQDPHHTRTREVLTRLRLFATGLFFLVAALSLGWLFFLLKRLFGFELPSIARIFVNYISAVKLYNQRTRSGGGFFSGKRNFLDAIDDPPRVSVRRRMVNAIAQVASRPDAYDRWYVLSHSLGSVVAFNGIMENGQAFANYLNREDWDQLCAAGFAGPKRAVDWAAIPPGPMSPARPVWLSDDDVVYRDRLFEKFSGLLTYGSPIGKFASLWPARVPINKTERAFHDKTEWINVLDLRDPVSGLLTPYEPSVLTAQGVSSAHCPPLQNFGYAASSVLLLSHICYFNVHHREGRQLADVLADWLVKGGPFTAPGPGTGRWYDPQPPRGKGRLAVSWVQWILAFLILAYVAVYAVYPAVQFMLGFGWPASEFWFSARPLLLFLVGCAGVVLAAGLVGRLLFEDDRK